MKVAFISTILHHPWGGADTLWTRAAEAASARGDALLLAISPATAGHPRIAALEAAGATIFFCKPASPPSWLDRLRRKLGMMPASEAALNAALVSFRPDLVIISQGGTYDLLMYPRLVAWFAHSGTPFRVIANWQQETPSLAPAELAASRTILEAAELVAFVSSRNLVVTRRHLCTPLPRACVLHNPLRIQTEMILDWPRTAEARLATVSRLDDSKGIHLLLHALAELGASLPGWHLTIHGIGAAEPALRDRIARLELTERVHLAGHVGDLHAIWGQHELLLSPALDEGVPMTIPEAMLCGRPALATCVGGAEDWIRDDQTGFLCPAPTVPLLAATLQRAFRARDQWPAMGQAAAIAAQRHYRPEDFRLLLT